MTEKKIKDFERVNFYIHSKSGVEYEVELADEMVDEEFGCEFYLCRAIFDDAGEVKVYEAFSDDYDIGADITSFIDIKALKKFIRETEKSEELSDQTEDYLGYYENLTEEVSSYQEGKDQEELHAVVMGFFTED